MKIKTFYAKTMAEAMQEIKAALGADALLLSSKQIPNRSGLGGRASGFEVVAACDDSSIMESTPPGAVVHQRAKGPVARKVSAHSPTSFTRPGSEAPHGHTACCARLSSQSRATGISENQARELPFSDAPSSALYQDLLNSGVEEWLARKLLLDARDLLVPPQSRSRPALLRAAGSVARSLVPASKPTNGAPLSRIVAFVGPTGVGKTTTLAKLAAQLALQQKKKVMLMTLDSFRIGAAEQLRTYAGLMGIPFRFVNQPADFQRAVFENKQRDYILIDTAGRAPRDSTAIQSLAEYLQPVEPIDCHLVLSATTKPSDIQDAVDRFEICRPGHLLFTKLDETSTLGPILNELIRARKSMSYYSDGQRVPEDLHPAPAEHIVDLVLHRN